jgi:hypothetical protein
VVRTMSNSCSSVVSVGRSVISGKRPICAIAPDLRRGGGGGRGDVGVTVDPVVAMVAIVSILSLLLSPVHAGADDGALV